MKRENYYRSNNEPDESREAYHHQNYQTPNQGPAYTNYNNYDPQQPYYPPRRHHHVFLWIVVIILCLGLGWFAADHFIGGDTQSSQPSTTVNKTVNNKTTNNKQPAQQQTPQQPRVNKLQREMSRLNVNTKDQTTAVNFYEKQSPKNQAKMNKMISLVNKVIPSDTMKKQALSWILHN